MATRKVPRSTDVDPAARQAGKFRQAASGKIRVTRYREPEDRSIFRGPSAAIEWSVLLKRIIVGVAVVVLSCSGDSIEERVLNGDVDATIELAGHYFIGSEEYPTDTDKAVSLLLPLSEEGNPKAQHLLGVIKFALGDIGIGHLTARST